MSTTVEAKSEGLVSEDVTHSLVLSSSVRLSASEVGSGVGGTACDSICLAPHLCPSPTPLYVYDFHWATCLFCVSL